MFRLFSLQSRISEIGKCLSNNMQKMSQSPNLSQTLVNRNIETNNLIVWKRTVIYYSHSSGKLKSNKAVLRRFYRLNWGAWIRPRAGRHKHLWRKPYHIRWWAKQHVFCTDEQNKVLDQMVDEYYKIPTYFVDDPYEPYQKRHNFPFVPIGKTSVSTSYANTLYDYKTDD